MMIRFLESISIKKIILFVLLVFVAIFSVLYFYNPFNANVADLSAEAFDSEGFSDIKDLKPNNVFETIFENGNYKFEFNSLSTHFQITDKKTNQILKSNPLFANKGIDNTILEKQQSSIFILTYLNDKNIETQLDSNSYSVIRDEGLDKLPGESSFGIKKGNNFLQVYYEVQKRGVDKTYIPEEISKDRMEELFLNSDLLDNEQKRYMREEYYKLFERNENGVTYYYYKLQKTSKIILQRMYNLMYGSGIYSKEELLIDSPDISPKDPLFKVCVEYQFEETGFKTKILYNSIVEGEPILKINLLPYFGCSKENEEIGKYIIPDGSGAVINFNNNKGHFNQIRKRIYGADKAYVDIIEREKEESLLLPMYAVSYDSKNLSFINHIDKGRAHTQLNVQVPQSVDKFNRASYTFLYREVDNVTYGSNIYDSATIPVYTSEIVETDFITTYDFINTTSYSEIAKYYQKYLQLDKKSLNEDLIVDMNLLGAYSFKNFFLGIGYNDYKTLTTFEEAIKIYEAFKQENVQVLNLNYQGWSSEGLEQKTPIKLKMSDTLGSKKELDLFNQYMKENQIQLAYSTSLTMSRGFDQNFFENKYLSRTIGWDYSINYPMDKPTMTFNKKKTPIYTVSPKYYQEFSEELLKSYKQTKNTDSIYLEDLGTDLNSDFKRRDVIFREQTLEMQRAVLQMISENFNSVKMNVPLMDYINFADFIKNVPTKSTLYPVYDYSIPFYQLLISGFVEYSMMDYNEGILTQKMKVLKAIETGSNLSLTMCYQDTSDLLDTTHEQYFNNKYSNWTKEIGRIYDELNKLNIFNAALIEHSLISTDIYKVKYSNSIEIILNYTLNDFTYNGVLIPSNDYKVVNA